MRRPFKTIEDAPPITSYLFAIEILILFNVRVDLSQIRTKFKKKKAGQVQEITFSIL